MLGPDAKPGIVSHHNEIIVPAAAELNGAFEAHRAADIDVDDATGVVGVSDKGLDDICERIDLTVRLNFGDAAVAWGFWLIGGLGSGWLPGLLTVIAPIAMTHFVRNVTGAKLLERTMSQRPGWDAYAARVPLFFPRPPRRAAG